MFDKILVANRGEIAVRILRTLREMGIATVAVYSDVDADAPHVALADEAVHLPGVSAAETYLRIPSLLEAARNRGAAAVHPGYGFLSENALFAESCAQAGLAFLGPDPEVIRQMGDKTRARKLMHDAGVPVVPGWSGPPGAPPECFRDEARGLGYPVLVKAAAGGGGKGMRRVDREADLDHALEAAAREAGAAFGDATLYLEKYLDRPRHVEIQIFGDAHGQAVHLFERECSVQRRHQKIVEETPSPALDEEVRRAMGQAACRAARAMGYRNAGTVEFLLDSQGRFYFLEVNARLQVEHPITEALLGLDLVRLQVEVAAGLPLPFRQEDLLPRGHALECRVYAEDPERGFLPSTGRILRYLPPEGPGIRVDSGVAEGSEVTVHYDPLLAKVVTWARTRAQNLEKMRRALDGFILLGPTTNLSFLRRLLDHPEFVAGRLHTHLLESHPVPPAPSEPPLLAWAAAALAAREAGRRAPAAAAAAGTGEESPWAVADGWRAP